MKDKIVEQIKEVLTPGKNENEYYIPYVGLWYFHDTLELYTLFTLIYNAGFKTGKEVGKEDFQKQIKELLDIKDAD